MPQLTLISGLPGSGKTTLVQRLADSFGAANCIGFFTQELREQGQRTGFFWQTFQGQRGILADLESGQPRVGKYRVHLESFEKMLLGLGSVPPERILVIDEVGKMECLSARFRELLTVWETSACPRFFTVPEHGTPFIEAFKTRHRNFLVQLTVADRQQILESLKRAFKSP